MLVVSPFARVNHVDSDLTDQASILNLVEYNWHLPGIPGSADHILSRLDRFEGLKFDLAGMLDFSHPTGEAVDPRSGDGPARSPAVLHHLHQSQ